VLASNLTRFSAVLQGPAVVQLDWSVVNEIAGRQYLVQRSQDGQHFMTIASLGATGTADYTYNDNLPAAAAGKWYYRLQIDDPAGTTWSAIKQVMVTITGGPGLSVYPNPAVDFVDLAFDPGAGSGAGWQVELFATDGSRVLSGNYLLTNTIHLNFPRKLTPGVYMLRTTGLQGQGHFINRILIR
jgi:hypothetical protein